MEVAIVALAVVALLVVAARRSLSGNALDVSAVPKTAAKSPPLSRDELFAEVGKRFGINPGLLKGIARQESNIGLNRGPGKVGELGLMQIAPVNWSRRPLATPNDWKNDDRLSVEVAAEILSEYRSRNNWTDPNVVIAAYNWGPGKVRDLIAKGGHIPADLPPQVRAYVDRVRGFASTYISANFPDHTENLV